MTTPIAIANRALQHLGQARINAFDEPLHTAREVGFALTSVRDRLLSLHPWNFASARVHLAAVVGSDPSFAILPPDCLRVLRVADTGGRWRIEEARRLFPETAPPWRVHYLRRIEDVTSMPPWFQELLSLRLALEMVPVFAPSGTTVQLLERRFAGDLALARSIDAQEGAPESFDASSWLAARN